jgi:hypothetical protein
MGVRALVMLGIAAKQYQF